VQAGQDAEAFPRRTFREIAVIVQAAGRRDAQQAWLAAMYTRYAYHQPNEMPEDPAGPPPKRETHTAADEAYVRAWMRAMSGESHGS